MTDICAVEAVDPTTVLFEFVFGLMCLYVELVLKQPVDGLSPNIQTRC